MFKKNCLEKINNYLLILMVVSFGFFLIGIPGALQQKHTYYFYKDITIKIPDGTAIFVKRKGYRTGAVIYFTINNEKYLSNCPSKSHQNICKTDHKIDSYFSKDMFFYPYFKDEKKISGIIKSGMLTKNNHIVISESNSYIKDKKENNIQVNKITSSISYVSFFILIICFILKILLNKKGISDGKV